jgi:hypothetical protein
MNDELPRIDPAGQVCWIAEQTDIASNLVETVLDLEFEYMVAAGIAYSDTAEWHFRYYDPDSIADSIVIDVDRIATDAERLENVPRDIASRILDSELAYLQMRGIAL